jgi:hypothetical protein
MRNLYLLSVAGIFSLILLIPAQSSGADEGIDLQWLVVQPEVGALGAYDNRVELTAEDEAEGDFYSELTAGVQIRNRPARYDFFALANYGYRFYSDYTELDDDFYRMGIGLKSDDGRLNWGADSDYRKSLDYDTSYNPTTGEGPDSILTPEENKRTQARAFVSYDQELSDRVSFVPEYSFWYYHQDFSGGTTITNRTEEWTVHRINLPIQYGLTDKTIVSAGVRASMQSDEDEEGFIGTLYAGARGQVSDKTSWNLYLGVSAADYEESGSEVGGVSRGRLVWQATEKVNAYVFGGNAYEPGYGVGRGARMVYRLGYGASWNLIERWSVAAQGLHDYQREVGDNSDSSQYGSARYFATVRTDYSLPKWAKLSLVGRYINDEIKVDQMIVSLELSLSY